MNINATFFVQVFNFVIVYLMLRFFLFKPVITIIQQEEDQEKSLKESIDQQKKHIALQEKERQRNWQICQEYLILHRPSFSQEKYLTLDMDTNEPEQTLSLSAQDINNIVIDVRTVLEEKIKHVH